MSVFVCVCVLFAKCEAMVLKTRELSRLKKKTLGVHIIYSSFTCRERIICKFVCVCGRHLTEGSPLMYGEGETGFLWSWNFMISKVYDVVATQ